MRPLSPFLHLNRLQPDPKGVFGTEGLKGNFSRIFLAALIVITLAGCVKQSELDALEQETRDLSQKSNDLKKEAASLQNELKVKESLSKKYQSLQKQEGELRLEMEQVHTYVGQLQATSENLEKALAAWRQATRRSLVGMRLGQVNLPSGQTLADAEVAEFTDRGVKLKTAQGLSEVPMEELPEQARLMLVHETTILAKSLIAN